MAEGLNYPIKLDDTHASGIDACGDYVEWDEALEPGQRTGRRIGDDIYLDAVVVSRDGGLWVDEVSGATRTAWHEEALAQAVARSLVGRPVNGETAGDEG